MIENVLRMCKKVSEFSFYPEGSNEGWKTRFRFFCKDCHLNSINIFRSRQLILKDMTWHILQMCSKASGFSFCPLGSYEGRKMMFSVIKGLSLELHLHYFQIVDKWYSRIWLDMSCRCAIRFLNFYFHPWSQIRVKKIMFLFRVL